jgi:lipoprotein-anchoring transpeptidase ErfK/SrfK
MSKRIEVDLTRQVLTAYEAGRKCLEFDCATGDRSHPTTPGAYHILRKHRDYTSIKYRVPMDFAMFFSADGKAIHKSHMVGTVSYLKYAGLDYFGSHGCVRLAGEDAEALFDWAPVGTPVDVRRD